jgi:hypothetical protein
VFWRIVPHFHASSRSKEKIFAFFAKGQHSLFSFWPPTALLHLGNVFNDHFYSVCQNVTCRQTTDFSRKRLEIGFFSAEMNHIRAVDALWRHAHLSFFLKIILNNWKYISWHERTCESVLMWKGEFFMQRGRGPVL